LALEEMLDASKMSYFVISGNTSAQKREEYKDAFQTSDRYRVGLLSITAAGVGLTLTAASTEVFTEILFLPTPC
jgi:SWI/SNF-related matrix-associated actin-dependent regulator 1 of chromatin subfamily A